MQYFTIEELCYSSTANKHRINNKPTPNVENNLIQLIENVLDPLRSVYGFPIHVNSGYRSEYLNTLVGGAKNSQHKYGQAADITTGSVTNNKKLFNLAISLDLPYDQIIDEKNYQWVHISYKPNPRKQILHL